MRVLVTGAAGFLGHHLALRLLERGDEVSGLDHLGGEGAALKVERFDLLRTYSGFRAHPVDLRHRPSLERVFIEDGPERVVHLAADVGVRESAHQPRAYVENNVLGFTQLLDRARHGGVEHLVFASSSAVYGAAARLPFREEDATDHPLSVYGATKKADELLAHAFAHGTGLPCTALRFFNVYGPSGRADMIPMKFTRAMLEGRTIELHAEGRGRRDYTFVDDAIEATVRALDRLPAPRQRCREGDHAAPFRAYNVGSGVPVELLAFVEQLEEALGIKAKVQLVGARREEQLDAWADVSALEQDLGFRPRTPLLEGLARMVDWLRGRRR